MNVSKIGNYEIRFNTRDGSYYVCRDFIVVARDLTANEALRIAEGGAK